MRRSHPAVPWWRFPIALIKARRWLATERAGARSEARPLEPAIAGRLRTYFSPATLERVRIVERDSPPNPPLEAWLGLDSVSIAAFDPAGITLDDFIFVKVGETQNASLLFHELVHVVQWRALGRNRFLAAYGLLSLRHGYRENPLEDMAYALQEAFDRGMCVANIESEVAMRTQAAVSALRDFGRMGRWMFGRTPRAR